MFSTVPCVRFHIAEGGAALYRPLCIRFYTAGGGRLSTDPCVRFNITAEGRRSTVLCSDLYSRGEQLPTVSCGWFYVEAGMTSEGGGSVGYPPPPLVGRVEVE